MYRYRACSIMDANSDGQQTNVWQFNENYIQLKSSG